MGHSGLKWGKVERDSDAPTLLLGEYDHTIDDKNRLTLPARFRESFADGAVVTRGFDGCLFVYTRAQWSEIAQTVNGYDQMTPEGRRLRRFFFSGAAEDRPDKQGRIAVPSVLAERAGLGRDVVVAGVGDRLEVWNRSAWRRELELVEGSAEDVAQRLAAARH